MSDSSNVDFGLPCDTVSTEGRRLMLEHIVRQANNLVIGSTWGTLETRIIMNGDQSNTLDPVRW